VSANDQSPRGTSTPALPLRLTRREWLQNATATAALLPQGFQRGGRGRSPFGGRRVVDPSQIPAYRFKTMSVGRFAAMQSDLNTARGNTQFGASALYRNLVTPLKFEVPRDFPTAKSVVVVAAFSKNMYATFRLNGAAHRVLLPYQYYEDDYSAAKLKSLVQTEIVKTPNRRIVDISKQMPLKMLAGRTGLGRYARNGLVFVDGMGSYAVLFAFLTDHPFAEDAWVADLPILDECNRCHACERSCPTQCINRWSYGANVDKCITLFNENLGQFPTYIYGSMHHALMGCMRCSEVCPVNEGIAQLSGTLEEVTEEETRKILNGSPDDALLASLQRKLRGFRAVASREQFPILKRNLGVLLRA
jgi:epoxyqueuosine reductase